VTVLDHFYYWTYEILLWGLAALRVWAAVDCATRKAAAFPAVDKLTKPSWLAITIISAVFAVLPGPFSSPLGPISLVGTVASCVYLADVRPAVREFSRGR
jgi:hypothetical protein